MSRPRKPFGANHPGRLPATMIKVLAAEMSDPSRLRRGKQYAKDGSVLDIIIEPGVVTCEIQGSRSTPYIAAVEVNAGDGMPLRRDIRTNCTCPDDANWDGYACKHVVAALFTLSDEFLLEPELLDLWRNRTTDTASFGVGPEETSSVEVAGRHLRLVRSGEVEPGAAEPRQVGRRTDPLEVLLRVPAGTSLPEIADIERIEPVMPKSRVLATVLRDALSNLRIDWD
ncbi:MAG TPA: SWIM zinc finger family protein [Ilumatobacteraceae bacterium]|nr:SWIM zinc finger family protein [Ilumatobacteraceae bacterium]